MKRFEGQGDMPLKGDVASFSLPEIFNSLSLNQSTGTLMVSDGETCHHLYFQRGGIIPISDARNHILGIGEHLKRNKLISGSDLEKAQQMQASSRRKMIDVLVQEGIISEDDLFLSLKEQMQEEIYNLFLWKDAFFEFKKDEAPEEYATDLDDLGRFTFNSGQILMEAARRADEWNRIKVRIPSLKYIFTRRKEEKLALGEKADNPVPLDKIEPLLSSSNNVEDIIEATGYSKFDVCKTLYLLLIDWQVRSLPPSEAESCFKDALRDGNYRLGVKYLEYAMELGMGAKDAVEKMQVALLGDPRFTQTPDTYRISGSLENVNFASFFITLLLKKHTCTVRVTDPDSKKILYVSPTEIAVLSHGAREQAQFGQILVREGKITCRQLDKALTQSKKTGELLGKTLIAAGVITQDDQVFAVSKKIIDEIFDIFLWRNARFEFVKNRRPEEFDDPKARVSQLSLVAGTLSKEIVSSLTHFQEISKQISTRAIFKKDQKKGKKEMKGVFSTWLSKMDDPAEETAQGLLKHVDGSKTVRDIIRISRKTAIEVAEELYSLMNRGEIRPLTLEEIKASAEKTLKDNAPEECIRFCEYGMERGGDSAAFQKILDAVKAQSPDIAETTREFKLEGDFMTFSLAELFQSLFLNKHSGTLEVSDGLNEKMVYFSKGVICLITKGSRSVSRLGDILIDAGKIKESDVERALEIQKVSGKLLGEILVEEGIDAEEDINEAVKEKIKEELFDIFLWENAHFTFTKNYFPEEFEEQKGVTRMSLDTGRILMKAVSRIEEWNRIQNAFKSVKSVPFTTGTRPDPATLDRKQRIILNLVDGKNNVEDIIDQSRVGKFEACKILYDFKKRTIVDEMDLQRLNREAEKAFEAKNFEMCVKFYEAAMQFDTENEFLRQYLEMIKGNIAAGPQRKKIVMKGFDLTTLFRSILRDRTSGTLTAKDSKSRRFFYLAPDEFLALAEGERRGRGLEEHLVAAGKVSDKQLARAKEYAQKMNSGLAEILEKQGVIGRKEVEELGTEIACGMLFELFDWTEVNIEFEASSFLAVLEDREKPVLEIKAPSWPIIENALGKHETLESFKKVIPSTDIIFIISPGGEVDIESLPAQRRAVAALVDGRRRFMDVLALSGLPVFDAYSAAAKLIERAIIRPLSTAEAIKEAENSKVFNEFEQALAFFKSALACDPHNNEIKEKIEALKRSIISGVSAVPGSEMISGVSMDDLVRNLLRNPKTGTLQAKDRDSERNIHISEDRVLLVSTGSRQGQRIGEVLVECMVASQQHVDKALDFQKKSPSKKLGEILLLQGVVTEKDIQDALKEKVLGDIGDLFGWDKASFSFTEGAPPDIFKGKEIPVTEYACTSKELLEEALERKSQKGKIDAAIRSPNIIFRITEAGQAAQGSGAYSNRVLRFLDGKTSLDTAMRKLKGSRFSLRQEVFRLIQNGVIEPLPLDLARKKGHELYMFNDFVGCAALYRWAVELDPRDERMIRNLERAEKYLKGTAEPG